MISNEYAHELAPVPELDPGRFVRLHRTLADPKRPATWAKADDHPELKAITDRYPILGQRVALFLVNPNDWWRGLHMDGASADKHQRLAAVNIPLYRWAEVPSYTEFFRMLEGCRVIDHFDPARGISTQGVDHEMCEHAFSLRMKGPTILNVQAPHTVRNMSNHLRRVVSFSSTVSYQETIRFFQEQSCTKIS